jgi:hypothetical protein
LLWSLGTDGEHDADEMSVLPDVLCDPATVGKLESDYEAGFVDYVADTSEYFPYTTHPGLLNVDISQRDTFEVRTG